MTHQARCTKCDRPTSRKSATTFDGGVFCRRCWEHMPRWMHRKVARAEATQ